ncbi:thioredoxin [Pontibacillus yanchengensis]|uniref:Thioredoxin n=2 Tax=Pontibacillus yanchengensis TaxID=462910 RepID=A0ACC7VK87_9BACI|nr:thioredoxin family protein [Pontibacillus yanchengensis]MYL33714.1 thioredoxin [Pontibacillus yanchengensis]MYL55388.1 thioredoxin [Pontibacillus yanchengensis]
MQLLEEDPLQALQKSSKAYEMTFIHSPFCGTCHIARKMLETLEATKTELTFNELNASIHPNFMHTFQIESVPCLLITDGMDVEEKVYAFHSVPYMYQKVSEYEEV